MAAARLCDRCDKPMKIDDSKMSTVELTYYTHTYCFKSRHIEHLDLCDECLDDFRKFLSEKPAR